EDRDRDGPPGRRPAVPSSTIPVTSLRCDRVLEQSAQLERMRKTSPGDLTAGSDARRPTAGPHRRRPARPPRTARPPGPAGRPARDAAADWPTAAPTRSGRPVADRPARHRAPATPPPVPVAPGPGSGTR